MALDFRAYDPTSDRDAAMTVLREVGWFQGDDNGAKAHELWFGAGRSYVTELDGKPECLVVNFDGRMRYLEEDLPLCIVGGVLTGHVARQQRFATRLTAEAIAADVLEREAAVAILGMFEQGFYDRLGFGTGSTIHMVAFDPATLTVPVPSRAPVRLTLDDHARIYASRIDRRRVHGGCTVDHPESTRADMLVIKDGFGLGFVDPDSGALTHHLWCSAHSRWNGPYQVKWLAFRTRDEFLDLMGLLKGLGDQVNLVRMAEPPGMQFQDLVAKPFHRARVSHESTYDTRTNALAWWQVRICDLPACMEKTRLPTGEGARFHLRLADPIAEHLNEATKIRWSGVAGDYVVTLGPESHAERVDGPQAGMPSMSTSINTFTRLWLGVSQPSALAYTSTDLDAPQDLLERLDRTVVVRPPSPDWDF